MPFPPFPPIIIPPWAINAAIFQSWISEVFKNCVHVTFGEPRDFYKIVDGVQQPGGSVYNVGDYAYVDYTLKNASTFRLEDLFLEVVGAVTASSTHIVPIFYYSGGTSTTRWRRYIWQMDPGEEVSGMLVVKAHSYTGDTSPGEIILLASTYGEIVPYAKNPLVAQRNIDVEGI